jgi:hypothetical protein
LVFGGSLLPVRRTTFALSLSLDASLQMRGCSEPEITIRLALDRTLDRPHRGVERRVIRHSHEDRESRLGRRSFSPVASP